MEGDDTQSAEAAALEIGRQTGGELSSHVEGMGSYSVIYIGFPIWWYQEPMAVRTFLEEYDFSGKTLIPFCTTLGAGIGESEENIRSLCPGAVVLEELTLHTGQDSFEEDFVDDEEGRYLR